MIQASEIRRLSIGSSINGELTDVWITVEQRDQIADALDELVKAQERERGVVKLLSIMEKRIADLETCLKQAMEDKHSELVRRTAAQEAITLHWIPHNHALAEALKQAHKTLSTQAHEPGCKFSGCTCGSVDAFKAERTEFYRQYNARIK